MPHPLGFSSVQFSSVTQSCLTLCNPVNRSTPGLPIHHQPWSLPKLMSIESVMPSNHLIPFCHPFTVLCHPLLLLPSIFPSISEVWSLEEVMTNLDSILKSRDITLPTKVHLVKAMVFPVVMYGCESWTIKKAECQRIDAFELWCWRRLLRVPWTARKSNQSILKEISPEYSLEGLMLKF